MPATFDPHRTSAASSHAALADGVTTLTFLFTDIVGSTALTEQIGDIAWDEVVSRHDQLVRSQARMCGVVLCKPLGDGFLLAFSDAADGVRCALAIQAALKREPLLAAGCPLRVRMGAHTGQAVLRDGDVHGRAVNFAARLAQAADGGELLVSETVTQGALDCASRPVCRLGRRRRLRLRGIRGRQTARQAVPNGEASRGWLPPAVRIREAL